MSGSGRQPGANVRTPSHLSFLRRLPSATLDNLMYVPPLYRETKIARGGVTRARRSDRAAASRARPAGAPRILLVSLARREEPRRPRRRIVGG